METNNVICPTHDTPLNEDGLCEVCLTEKKVGPAVSFPQAGLDLTPTREQLLAGRVGNGAWNLTDESVQLAYAEQHQIKKEARDERREFFNERAKDALSDAVDLHHRLIKQGQLVMEKIETEDQITKTDFFVLTKALGSAKELTDRAAGKPKTDETTVEKSSMLAFLVQGENNA